MNRVTAQSASLNVLIASAEAEMKEALDECDGVYQLGSCIAHSRFNAEPNRTYKSFGLDPQKWGSYEEYEEARHAYYERHAERHAEEDRELEALRVAAESRYQAALRWLSVLTD